VRSNIGHPFAAQPKYTGALMLKIKQMPLTKDRVPPTSVWFPMQATLG